MGSGGSKHHHHHTTVVREDPQVAKEKRLQRQFELEQKSKDDAAQRQHELDMARKNNERAKEKEKHELELAVLAMQQTQEALEACERKVDKCQNNIFNDEKRIQELSDSKNRIEEKINVLNEWIDNFDTYRMNELNKEAIMIGLEKAKEELKRCEIEINNAIDMCQIDEDNIVRFLKLTHGLLTTTLENQEHANKLDVAMSTFDKLIQREVRDKLLIKDYFEDRGWDYIVSILSENGFTTMNELLPISDDENVQKEFCKELIDTINDNLREKYEKWEREKKESENDPDSNFDKPKPTLKKLTLMHKNELKRVCLRPDIWKAIQQRQMELTKESLNDVAPTFSIFFNKINVAMDQAQLLLNYDKDLNNDQLMAIKNMNTNVNNNNQLCYIFSANNNNYNNNNNDNHSATKPEILTVGNDDNDNDEKHDIVTTTTNSNNNNNNNDNNIGEVECIADEFETMDISNNDNDNINNIMAIQSLKDDAQIVLKQSNALNTMAISNINVIKSMSQQFLQSANGTRALALAESIENTCMKIIRCRGYIRQSIMLCLSILQLRPAIENLNETNNVWNSIDTGIEQIFKNAKQLSKISQQYFQFFVLFRSSFDDYYAKRNDTLYISTKKLREDIRSFSEFSSQFEKEVDNLGESAMECISKCVRNTVGFETFENARQQRSKLTKNYLDRKKIYDEKESLLEAQYGQKLNERAELKARFKTKELIIDSLTQQVNHERNLMMSTQETIKRLRERQPNAPANQ